VIPWDYEWRAEVAPEDTRAYPTAGAPTVHSGGSAANGSFTSARERRHSGRLAYDLTIPADVIGTATPFTVDWALRVVTGATSSSDYKVYLNVGDGTKNIDVLFGTSTTWMIGASTTSQSVSLTTQTLIRVLHNAAGQFKLLANGVTLFDWLTGYANARRGWQWGTDKATADAYFYGQRWVIGRAEETDSPRLYMPGVRSPRALLAA